MYSPEKSEAIRQSLNELEKNMYLSGYHGSVSALFGANSALYNADERIKELEDTVAELTRKVVALTATQSPSIHEAIETTNEKRTENMRRFPELAPDVSHPDGDSASENSANHQPE